MKEHEEVKENNGKLTDNKDTTFDPDNNHTANSETDTTGESTATTVEALEEGTVVSDKVLADLKAAEEKLAEMQDKYLRLSAEFDNYRKRTLREKIDLSKYAGENLFRGIIPLIDDFERALRHIDSTPECISLKDGIDIIYVKFNDFLKQNGVTEIESLNCEFNVDLHEAVAKVPVEDVEKKGKVIEVMLKGYYLQDKVLRFAKVVVGE